MALSCVLNRFDSTISYFIEIRHCRIHISQLFSDLIPSLCEKTERSESKGQQMTSSVFVRLPKTQRVHLFVFHHCCRHHPFLVFYCSDFISFVCLSVRMFMLQRAAQRLTCSLLYIHTYICSSVVKFYALSCDDDTQSKLLATRTMTTNLRGRHTNRMECCTRRFSFALRYFVVPFLRYHFTHKKLVWVMVCMQREARLTRHEQGTTSLTQVVLLNFS